MISAGLTFLLLGLHITAFPQEKAPIQSTARLVHGKRGFEIQVELIVKLPPKTTIHIQAYQKHTSIDPKTGELSMVESPVGIFQSILIRDQRSAVVSFPIRQTAHYRIESLLDPSYNQHIKEEQRKKIRSECLLWAGNANASLVLLEKNVKGVETITQKVLEFLEEYKETCRDLTQYTENEEELRKKASRLRAWIQAQAAKSPYEGSILYLRHFVQDCINKAPVYAGISGEEGRATAATHRELREKAARALTYRWHELSLQLVYLSRNARERSAADDLQEVREVVVGIQARSDAEEWAKRNKKLLDQFGTWLDTSILALSEKRALPGNTNTQLNKLEAALRKP